MGGVLRLRGVTRIQFPLLHCVFLLFDNARVARYKFEDSESMLLETLCRVLYQKSTSQDISDDQMFPNLILKLSLANVGISHSENELSRLQCEGDALQG
jgi:hypothetical protein